MILKKRAIIKPETYAATVQGLRPYAWWRMNTALPIANSGSDNTTLQQNIAGFTAGQASALAVPAGDTGYRFDATGGQLVYTHNATYASLGDISAAGFVKPATTTAGQRFILVDKDMSFSIVVKDRTICFDIPNVAFGPVSTSLITVGVWSHVAITRLAGVGRIYINGVLASVPTAVPSAASTFPGLAGYNSTDVTQFDEIMFWPRALSVYEIAAIAQFKA